MRRGGKAGFSLVEVVCAIAILGMAIVTLFQIHDRGMDRAIRTKNVRYAHLLAEEHLGTAVLGLSDSASGESETAPGLTWDRDLAERKVIGEKKVLKVTVTAHIPDLGGRQPGDVTCTSYAEVPEEKTGMSRER